MAEALANAARRAGTDWADVTVTRTAAGLRVTVRDDGRGGATETAAGGGAYGGTGLAGMRRRVAALDGAFTVTSPPGGPTIIEAELPCVW